MKNCSIVTTKLLQPLDPPLLGSYGWLACRVSIPDVQIGLILSNFDPHILIFGPNTKLSFGTAIFVLRRSFLSEFFWLAQLHCTLGQKWDRNS